MYYAYFYFSSEFVRMFVISCSTGEWACLILDAHSSHVGFVPVIKSCEIQQSQQCSIVLEISGLAGVIMARQHLKVWNRIAWKTAWCTFTCRSSSMDLLIDQYLYHTVWYQYIIPPGGRNAVADQCTKDPNKTNFLSNKKIWAISQWH